MKIEFLEYAIKIAEKGRGLTSPNPFVGAVIVKNDVIIGEGYTQPWGKDHAEIQALKDAGSAAKGAEMYVTLEPCSHYGKTPPCAKAIIAAGIRAVYIGIKDPNPKVAGRGIEMMQLAGIYVSYGYLQKEITQQLEYYIKYISTDLPFVFMKNAVSIDGKIADDSGDSKWITNSLSREKVHKLRAEADAIISGVNTVNKDDALFNVRLDGYIDRNPIRIILDYNLEINEQAKIIKTANDIITIIYTSRDNLASKKAQSLLKQGVDIRSSEANEDKFVLKNILKQLHEQQIYSVMIEAGQAVSSSFLKERLVDKIYYFVAPIIIGGNFTVYSEAGVYNIKHKLNLKLSKTSRFADDILLEYYLENNK